MFIKSIGINYRHNVNFVKNFPNGTNEYILLLIKSKALFKIDGKIIHADPDSIIVYKKYSPQFFGADGEEFINDWICFDIDASECDFFDNVGISLDTIYKLDDTVGVSDFMQAIHNESIAESMYMRENISAYFKLLFYRIAELIHSKSAVGINNYSTKLKVIRNMIYNNPTKKWSAGELADEMHLSVSYFQHLYKAQFNVSPISDVINSRMKYAKYLLCSTDYSINAIATELNYGSDIQFIQQFKSLTKQTPLQYRKSSKNKCPSALKPMSVSFI